MKFIIASCLAILPLLVIQVQATPGVVSAVLAAVEIAGLVQDVAELIPSETKEEDRPKPINHNADQPDYEYDVNIRYYDPSDNLFHVDYGNDYHGENEHGSIDYAEYGSDYPGAHVADIGHRGGYSRGYPGGYGGGGYGGGRYRTHYPGGYGGSEYGGGGYRRGYPAGYGGLPRELYKPTSSGNYETEVEPLPVPFGDDGKQDSGSADQPQYGDGLPAVEAVAPSYDYEQQDSGSADQPEYGDGHPAFEPVAPSYDYEQQDSGSADQPEYGDGLPAVEAVAPSYDKEQENNDPVNQSHSSGNDGAELIEDSTAL